MLESMRRGQRWLTLLLVTFVGAVFVFFMGVGGGFGPQQGPAGNAVVELGETRLMLSDFQRLRALQEQTYSDQLGDQFDARAMRSFLDSQALRSLVESAVMAESAHAIGLRVSRAEVQRLVRQSPAFQDESGGFDHTRFVDYANYEFGSQRNFLNTMRQDLLRQKMIALIYDQAQVSEGEARDAALYGLEEVRIAYVPIETAFLPEDEKLSEEAVEAWLDRHRDELRALYDSRVEAEYTVPEEVWARHLLIVVGPEADADSLETARARAETARERIVLGEAFVQIAQEISEDPGTRDLGGDLGHFSRGTHSIEIEEAAFALEPGDLSEVVRSRAGFHLIFVEERTPASVRAFDDVGPVLARAAAEAAAAEEYARGLAERLAGAVRTGESLEDAARAEGLSLERTAMIRRRPDGFIPGLGGAPEAMAAAFTLRDEHPSSDRIFEVGTRLVLIQQLERSEPDPVALEEAVRGQSQTLLEAKRTRMIQDFVDRRRDELERSGRLLVNMELVLSNS
jgi:peptidyl-prolyl cis-trans isomerase D